VIPCAITKGPPGEGGPRSWRNKEMNSIYRDNGL
jgi:hypothetical protein